MDEGSQITLGDAYRAMFQFLEEYWRRGLKTDDQIASLLGSMQYGEELGPTKTMDPAQWADWIEAVKEIRQ
ncbi:MAG: hypothetical protein P8J20_14765 [Novosphingobium sp.]|nr:hypothetical protein [Novosphingobium sp.]